MDPSSIQIDAHGAGPAVLLLHGLGATSGVFDPVRKELGSSFRTLLVDLPHHARAKRWAALEPRAVAEALSTSITDETFYVVGHSFGGVAALELAALLPTRVRGVCAVAAPLGGIGPLRKALDSTFADWTMKIASRISPSTTAVRAYLKYIWGNRGAPTPGQIQQYLLAMEGEGHHAGTLQALRSLAQYSPPIDALRAAGTQVSLVFGQKDPLVPARHGDQLQRELAARVEVFAGAGHCIPEERPQELAAIIRREHERFLARAG